MNKYIVGTWLGGRSGRILNNWDKASTLANKAALQKFIGTLFIDITLLLVSPYCGSCTCACTTQVAESYPISHY
jgi:hypothetical protein